MFNLKEFIVKNIVNAVKNGIFAKEYANITAVNYLVKGILTEEDIANIDSQITAWEEEQASTNADVPEEVITESEAIVQDEPVTEEPDAEEEVTEPKETTVPEEEPTESVTEEPETNEPEETENEPVPEEIEPENTETETDSGESEPVE